jgi:HAD superfamily hydrolase (TIGR01509 family)
VALPRPAALIFDLDGTLVDTVEVRIAAWLRTFAEFDIPAARAHVARLIGSDGKRLARTVAGAAGVILDAERAEAIDRHAGDIYSELNVDPQPLPGAPELLDALNKRGLQWAVATSSRRDQVGASIQALKLSKRPTVIDGSHVKHAKPAPDLLLYAAAEIGVEPSRVWYVGDSIWDMEAAVKAAMAPIGVVTGSATAEDLKASGAVLTVDNLRQLLPLLDR